MVRVEVVSVRNRSDGARDREVLRFGRGQRVEVQGEKGLEKFRVTVSNSLTEGNPWRSSRAATDTDEDMVHILITNDSRAKLNVVRQLEPWTHESCVDEHVVYSYSCVSDLQM